MACSQNSCPDQLPIMTVAQLAGCHHFSSRWHHPWWKKTTLGLSRGIFQRGPIEEWYPHLVPLYWLTTDTRVSVGRRPLVLFGEFHVRWTKLAEFGEWNLHIRIVAAELISMGQVISQYEILHILGGISLADISFKERKNSLLNGSHPACSQVSNFR